MQPTRMPLLLIALALGCDDPVTEAPDEPTESDCAKRTAILPTAEELVARGVDIGFAARSADPGEEHGGIEFVDAPPELAPAAPSLVAPPRNAAVTDTDGDCLPDDAEAAARTSPTNPDTDGDGWFDGPCNERRRLVLTKITAHDEQEDIGEDELYLVADDRRFPTTSNLDGYWSFDDGDSRTFSLTLAQRVRGTNTTGPLATVRVEGWEDDVEAINTWWADDLLFSTGVNLGAYASGTTFKVRKTYSDYDYELEFRVVVDHFADPSPATASGDTDGDGIKESAEFQVAKDLGGIADPQRKDVLVELDWMKGHALETRARRLVTTRLANQGLTLQVRPSEELPVDTCLTRTEARALFDTRFQSNRFKAFRYAVMTEVIWNDASGAAISDTFFMDDSTWWISGGVLPQAGTFIHELGHTLGLTKELFRLIDTIATPGYDSAMNYFWQPSKVDYSHDGAGGTTNDNNDWAAVDAAVGLRNSFGRSTGADDGVCH